MAKIIFKTLFVFVIVWMGTQFYTSARNDRLQKIYDIDSKQNISEGKTDLYIDNMMVLLDVENYMNVPFYSFESTDEKYSFIFEMYHFEKNINGVMHYGILPFINDFKTTEYKNVLEDPSKFVKNKYTVGFEVKMHTEAGNVVITLPVLSPIYETNDDASEVSAKGGFFDSIYITKDKPTEYRRFSTVKEFVGFDEMRQIDLSLVDGTKDMKDPKYVKFATVNTNDTSKVFEESTFYRNEKGELVADGFMKTPHNIEELVINYTDNLDMISHPNYDVLTQYNSLVVKKMIIFSSIAVVGVFLMFFLKPLMNAFKARKEKKTVEK